MKTRKRFIRVVIAAAIIILLLIRFVGKWRYNVAIVPFMDVDIVSVSLEPEPVCRLTSRSANVISSCLCQLFVIDDITLSSIKQFLT